MQALPIAVWTPQDSQDAAQATPGAAFVFVGYLLAMVGVGLWSARRQKSQEDYFLGGRGLSPLVTALSAVGSGRSAWLMIGAAGAAWTRGLSALWMFPGYIAAEFAVFVFLGPRLRRRSEEIGALTIPEVLGGLAEGSRGEPGGSRLPVRRLAALVVIIFLATYVSAQLAAGGKALEYAFGFDGNTWGLVITAGIVLTYTLLGGYHAVAMTDAIQSFLMLFGLLVVPILGCVLAGGPAAVRDGLMAVDPDLLSLSNGTIPLLGGLAIGLGSFGNPHILVRTMSIEDAGGLRRSAWIGAAWNLLLASGTLGMGLVGRALYPEASNFPGGDTEQLYPLIGDAVSRAYLLPAFVGLLLATLFAAIMSTCDSQLLVVASSLVRDLRGPRTEGHEGSRSLSSARFAVLGTLAVAVAMSFGDTTVVNAFVLFSWAALGAAFGPPLLLLLFTRGTTGLGVVAGILSGAGMTVVWKQVLGKPFGLYELVPAFLLSLGVCWALSRRSAGGSRPADS